MISCLFQAVVILEVCQRFSLNPKALALEALLYTLVEAGLATSGNVIIEKLDKPPARP